MNIKLLGTNSNPTQSVYLQSANSNRQYITKRPNADSAQATNKSTDNNSIHAPTVQEARKLLNDKIIAALDKTLTQSNQTSLYELDPADFTPQKVADRILSFVGAAFSNIDNSNKERQNQRLEAAREGIEKGFNDAKAILEGLGAFEDGIADNANKTYDLLQTGLNQIATNIDAGVSVLQSLFQSSENNAIATQGNRLEKSTSLEQSFSLELKTQDGDKVTININRLDASHSSAYSANSTEEKTTAVSSSRLTESGYSISVNGALDQGEVTAIDKLLAKMTEVADKYFSGDTQAALDKVSQLGFNSSEIANFSLDLKEMQQTKATAAYQQFGGTENSPQLSQLMSPLQEYAGKLSEAHHQFAASELLDDNNKAFMQLLNQVTNSNHIFPDKAKVNQFEEFNASILALLP